MKKKKKPMGEPQLSFIASPWCCVGDLPSLSRLPYYKHSVTLIKSYIKNTHPSLETHLEPQSSFMTRLN
jgi:hypothetical protein